MKNWIDPDDKPIRGKRKKAEPKSKPKKADHKHEYINRVCIKCNKER